MEFVTPTGAAIAVTLAESFGDPPPMTLHKIALGAGQADLRLPNAVRLWIGEPIGAVKAVEAIGEDDLESVMLLETQVDDLNPQVMALVFERLLDRGALDVWTQTIAMKKQRSGLLISVLCVPALVPSCEDILFQETTTLGIRRSLQSRRILRREFETVETPYGEISVKLAYRNHEIWNIQPEYEDCLAIAKAQNIPWWKVHQAALHHWHLAQS